MKHFAPDAYLISHPKAGRTWVRMILAQLLKLYGGDPTTRELIRYRHDGFESHLLSFRLPYYDWPERVDKSLWIGKDVALLMRDPRDIAVSYYFELRYREKKIHMDLPQFIRDEHMGIYQIIYFYNQWLNQKRVPYLLITYELMKQDCVGQISKICKYLFLKADRPMIERAVEASSFENMRRIEEQGLETHYFSNRGSLRCLDKDNPEAYKTRRGEIGGWRKYLTLEDEKFVNDAMEEMIGNYYEI